MPRYSISLSATLASLRRKRPPDGAALLRRLQSRRVDPIVDMGRCIGAPRLAQQFVSLNSGVEEFGPFPRLLCERDQSILERHCSDKTTPFRHGAAPCSDKAGAQSAFSSPMNTFGP